MKATIIGFEIRSGKFTPEGKIEEVSFNNLFINATFENSYKEGNNYGFGSSVISEKIKNTPEVIERIFGSLVTVDDLESMVGSDFEFSYNQKGRLHKIYSLEAPAKPAAEKKGA